MKTQQLLSTDKTAEYLGISKASLKNWEKHGFLKPAESGLYREADVETLLEKIESGEINRLNKRANKSQSAGRINPSGEIGILCSKISEIKLQPETLMYLVALRLLINHGLVKDKGLDQLLRFRHEDFSTDTVRTYLIEYNPKNTAAELLPHFDRLSELKIPISLPAEKDIAGIIYQAIKNRGDRSRSGSFYTPADTSRDMLGSASKLLTAEGCRMQSVKFIDPCCGTGQFMLAFIESGGCPENAFGIDSDYTASFIAGINIILQQPELKTMPKIICADGLLSPLDTYPGFQPGSFDLAVTNPPWGATGKTNLKDLESRFRQIRSGETFSYFACRCIELLKPGGIMSLVLPESFLNVKRHEDIRDFLSACSSITKIENRGRIFNKVYSSALTLEGVKNKGIDCASGSAAESAAGESSFSFNININSKDTLIIDKIYSAPHFTFGKNTEWALGIVTGDNDRHLFTEQTADSAAADGCEPIIRGCDILSGVIKTPDRFIQFTPELYQQCAPEWKYRVPSKIVYRFINRNLIFALDKKRRLTLNSANIIIPDSTELEEWKMSQGDIVTLFNSEVFNFIYKKRFNSVKKLKSQLTQMPLMQPEKLASLLSPADLDYIRHQSSV